MSEQKMLNEYNAVAVGNEELLDDTKNDEKSSSFLPRIDGTFGIAGYREGRTAAQQNNEHYSDDDQEDVEQLYQAQLRAAQAASLAEAQANIEAANNVEESPDYEQVAESHNAPVLPRIPQLAVPLNDEENALP